MQQFTDVEDQPEKREMGKKPRGLKWWKTKMLIRWGLSALNGPKGIDEDNVMEL